MIKTENLVIASLSGSFIAIFIAKELEMPWLNIITLCSLIYVASSISVDPEVEKKRERKELEKKLNTVIARHLKLVEFLKKEGEEENKKITKGLTLAGF